MSVMRCVLTDERATEALGAALAAHLPSAGVVALQGPLGAGKTTLIRGLLRALGHVGRVRSPSYSLLESYQRGARKVLHLDLYRIADPAEIEYLGLREQLDGQTMVLVEWPQRAAQFLPPALLSVELAYLPQGRLAILSAGSTAAAPLLAAIHSSMGTEQCQLTDGLREEKACQ